MKQKNSKVWFRNDEKYRALLLQANLPKEYKITIPLNGFKTKIKIWKI